MPCAFPGMKALLLVSLLAQAAPPAVSTPVVRADVHAAVGWQNLHKEQPLDHYNNWLNNIFYAGAGAGWYWNDHLKTQVDFGAGTRGSQYRTRQFAVNGVQAFESSRALIRETNVTVGQQY